MSAKKLTPAQNATLAKLAQIEAQAIKKDVDKQAVTRAAKIAPETVSKDLHALAVSMSKADLSFDKALNAVYASFKAYAIAALPIIGRMPAHAAALADIKKVYGDARKAAAIQRITMLNNMRKIAYGTEATRDTPAQAAQGIHAVYDVLEKCASLPDLKKALTAMKQVKHAATGKAKTEPKAAKAAPAAKTSASDMPIPNSRAEAIQAACRILQLVSNTHLKAGTDSELVLEIEDVIEHLKRAAA
ncbi:MAG: hypothetical protein ACYC36_02465 [Bellilinea sp.]